MNTRNDLERQSYDPYYRASRMALKCAVCRSKPSMVYEVGTSIASCSCGVKMAIADGSANDILRLWNQLQLQPEINEQVIDRLIRNWEIRTQSARLFRSL